MRCSARDQFPLSRAGSSHSGIRREGWNCRGKALGGFFHSPQIQLAGAEKGKRFDLKEIFLAREPESGEPRISQPLKNLVVAAQYAFEDVEPLVHKARLTLAIAFSSADEHVARIRKLEQPSVIAVVSISANLLRTAQALLAPALGRRHTFCEYVLPLGSADALRGADVILCDSIAIKEVGAPKLSTTA